MLHHFQLAVFLVISKNRNRVVPAIELHKISPGCTCIKRFNPLAALHRQRRDRLQLVNFHLIP